MAMASRLTSCSFVVAGPAAEQSLLAVRFVRAFLAIASGVFGTMAEIAEHFEIVGMFHAEIGVGPVVNVERTALAASFTPILRAFSGGRGTAPPFWRLEMLQIGLHDGQ